MSLKAKLEAIVYAAEEPVSVEQMARLLKEEVAAAEGFDPKEEGALARVKARIRSALEELAAAYQAPEHGVEVRQVAGGFRMSTKPEHHEAVRAFAKSLKPAVRLSLPALETLSVIAYKQPITLPEINEIRGVDASAVIGTLLDRKLITTAGRKQVIGRPILYKTTREFLLRFGLKEVGELPSMEEFEKLAAEALEPGLFTPPSPTPEAVAAQTAAAEAPTAAPPPEAPADATSDSPQPSEKPEAPAMESSAGTAARSSPTEADNPAPPSDTPSDSKS